MEFVQKGSPTDFRRLCIIAQASLTEPKINSVLVLWRKWKWNVQKMHKNALKIAAK